MRKVQVVVNLGVPFQPVLRDLKSDPGRMQAYGPAFAGGVPSRNTDPQIYLVGTPKAGTKAKNSDDSYSCFPHGGHRLNYSSHPDAAVVFYCALHRPRRASRASRSRARNSSR